MFFWRPKERKAPAPAKSVITAFCSRVASDIPRLAVICHKQLFVQASGTKQLAFHAITASRICTAQTYFILFPMLARLFAVILMVPVSLLYYHCTRESPRCLPMNLHCKGNSPSTTAQFFGTLNKMLALNKVNKFPLYSFTRIFLLYRKYMFKTTERIKD